MTAARRNTTIALLATVVGIGLHLALLDRGHHGDTAVFRDWWIATRASPAELYTSTADVRPMNTTPCGWYLL